MSLESILNHILDEAHQQRDSLIQEAIQQKNKIIEESREEAARVYQEIIEREKILSEAGKQKLIVNVRLESKKGFMQAKQELIDEVFKKLKLQLNKDKFKKQQVSGDKVREVPEDIDFYLERIRPDYETEIAKIIFD
jgi:V/A-type H+-transporting ATPase subunit E